MKIKTFNSYNKALSFIKKLNNTSSTLLYRGQSSNKWILESSFYRLKKIKSLSFSDQNSEYSNVLNSFSKSLIEYGYNINDYSVNKEIGMNSYESLGQHYGIPTKLIDFTYSPYIALFFAFDGAGLSQNNSGYSSIYIFDYSKYLSLACEYYKTNDKKLVIKIMIEYGEYLVKVDANGSLDERVRRQKGTFIQASYDGNGIEGFLTSKGFDESIMRVDISTINKEEIINDLTFMNLTPGYLMADLEGVCRTVINNRLRF